MSICEISEESLASEEDVLRFNPFVEGIDTLELGRTLDLREVFEQYLRPEMQGMNRQRKTIQGVERQLRLFEKWWDEELKFWTGKSEIDIPRPIVASLTIQHLSTYQSWLRKNGRNGLYINNSITAIRQILGCAVSSGLITHVPKIRSVPAKKAAPKIYLNDDQLELMWKATEAMTWPRKRRGFTRLHYSPPMAWKCCLILWTLYGLRTQELVALEKKAKPLKWGNIRDDLETPNPAGKTLNEWGWLVYTPTKQEWVKPDPLYLPLSMHARAALEHLRPVDWTPEMAVCNWTFSSTSFYKAWHKLTAAAGIKPKTGDLLVPKHYRKTCATRTADFSAPAADYITGHAADRTGQTLVEDSGSKVSGTHYKNAENKVLECISTISVPACYDEILKSPLQ